MGQVCVRLDRYTGCEYGETLGHHDSDWSGTDIPTRLMAEKMLGITCDVQAQPNVSAPYKSVALLRRGVNAATPILHRGGCGFRRATAKLKAWIQAKGR